MPQLRVVSNAEWGQSKACFPLAQGMGRVLGVVRDGRLVAVDLRSGKAAAKPPTSSLERRLTLLPTVTLIVKAAAVPGVPGKCDGDIECATATPDGETVFFSTSTSIFGGGGELWR